MSESFFQKPMGIAGLIGSAIAGPYFYFGGVESPTSDKPVSAQAPLDPGGQLTGYTGQPGMALGPGTDSYASSGQVMTNAPISDFREILRFDISPAWVPQHFSRVTTVLADRRLDGLRVPLVTGIQPTDIAGSLTYFFDAQQALRRIQLVGNCGDPTVLVNLMLQYYHLQAEPSLGGHLFTSRWNNRVTSVLQLTPAPIIYRQDSHARYQIFLELNQPTMDYALTAEAEAILRTANLTQRW